MLNIALPGLLISVSSVGIEITKYRNTKKAEYRAAIAALRKGLNHTRIFLESPDFNDRKERIHLSDLWNNAAEKVGVMDETLADMLADKAAFWADYHNYIFNEMDNDVISLNTIKDQIDVLSNSFIKRNR